MSKKLRNILVAVGVVIVVLFILPFLIPVNQFRPTIEEKASAALGRKVQVGALSFSIFGGSLSAQDLSIGDDPKFSPTPFLTAKSLKVGVEILPLIFSKNLNVTGITITNPQITLLRNAAGVWNYSSIGGSAQKAQQKSAPSSSTSSSGDFSVKKFDLNDGTVILGATNSQKRSTYDHVNVSASDVSLTSKFAFIVTVDLPGGGKFKLDGNAGPVDQSDASVTPLEAKLTVGSLNLATTGVLDSSNGLGGLVDLDATLTSSNGEAQTKGSVKLSKALLVAGGSPASVSVTVEFDTRYDLHKNSGAVNPSAVNIGTAVAHLGGTYQTAGEATIVNIKVDGKDMPAKDLVSFLPALGINLPKGASLEAGTLSANLNLTGPTNKLVTTGNVGLFNAKLVGFDLGSKMSAISSFTGLKSGKDLDIEKITTDLHVAPDGLKAENFVAVLPSFGNVSGGGTIDSKNTLDFKMAATLTDALGKVASPVSSAGGAIGKLTSGGGNCKSGTTVPFQIQGTTADPKFIPDVGGLAAGMFKSQLGCVGGLATGGKSPAAAVGGLFKKKP